MGDVGRTVFAREDDGCGVESFCFDDEGTGHERRASCVLGGAEGLLPRPAVVEDALAPLPLVGDRDADVFADEPLRDDDRA